MTHPTDQQDQARFCAEAHPRLVAALTHLTGDRWLAEECAQEALIRACDRWARVSRLDSPVGWAFHVGANLARSQLRRRGAERRARERLQASAEERAMARPTDRAEVLDLRAALATLTDAQRQAVVMRHYLGMSVPEVAEALGKREGAVRALTNRAVTALREALAVPAPHPAVPGEHL